MTVNLPELRGLPLKDAQFHAKPCCWSCCLYTTRVMVNMYADLNNFICRKWWGSVSLIYYVYNACMLLQHTERYWMCMAFFTGSYCFLYSWQYYEKWLPVHDCRWWFCRVCIHVFNTYDGLKRLFSLPLRSFLVVAHFTISVEPPKYRNDDAIESSFLQFRNASAGFFIGDHKHCENNQPCILVCGISRGFQFLNGALLLYFWLFWCWFRSG